MPAHPPPAPPAPAIEKIVVVTRKTPLEDLVARLNTRAQARFYLEQNGVPFADYEQADATYHHALDSIRAALPRRVPHQVIDRDLLSTYSFGEHDLVLTVGPDGLVVNTAKYCPTQPILAVNPDPARVDGVLLPFAVAGVEGAVERALRGTLPITPVSMAQVTLNDGQMLLAFNDLFIGPRSHGSARYTIEIAGRSEQQSSSGIIISTGAGCTGWLRSLVTGAWGIAQHFNADLALPAAGDLALGWDSKRLWYTVREPFTSRTSQASIIFGQLAAGAEMRITSHMPDYGVIFSDGIEADYLAFNSGAIARIALSSRQAHLLAPAG
ncbi:MAG TPA: sugar kinase [Chloroflexia bacterium]|nr:sugar kinase [Chloroflexia bacterium]